MGDDNVQLAMRHRKLRGQLNCRHVVSDLLALVPSIESSSVQLFVGGRFFELHVFERMHQAILCQVVSRVFGHSSPDSRTVEVLLSFVLRHLLLHVEHLCLRHN